MTTRIYYSTDAGAPSLSGTQGTLISVLDWCLVSGAPIPAGWTKEYTTTNVAVFRPATGNRLYLRVDETYADASVSCARLLGYETMSAHSTGTGQFPASSQKIGTPSGAPPGILAVKSSTADATARPWVVIATESFVYVWCNTNRTNLNEELDTNARPNLYSFGDIVSQMTDDAYNTIVTGSNSVSVSDCYTAFASSGWLGDDGDVANFMARPFTQLQGSLTVSKTWNKMATTTSAQSGNATGLANPYPLGGQLFLSKFKIIEQHAQFSYGTNLNGIYRGNMPGMWAIMHDVRSLGFQDGSIMTNFYDENGQSLQGRTFMLKYVMTQNNIGVVMFETSNTW